MFFPAKGGGGYFLAGGGDANFPVEEKLLSLHLNLVPKPAFLDLKLQVLSICWLR
jgi:hypothetical protein